MCLNTLFFLLFLEGFALFVDSLKVLRTEASFCKGVNHAVFLFDVELQKVGIRHRIGKDVQLQLGERVLPVFV